MRDNGRLIWQLLAGLLIVGVAAAILPAFGRRSVRGPQTYSLSNAKQLATGCRLYAVDHGGRFPVHLSELEPDYVANLQNLRGVLNSPDENPGGTYDWLYFGAGFTDDKPPTVLIASSYVYSKPGKTSKRVVIHGDVSGLLMNEDQYEKELARTVGEMRVLDDALRPTKPAPSELPGKDAPAK